MQKKWAYVSTFLYNILQNKEFPSLVWNPVIRTFQSVINLLNYVHNFLYNILQNKSSLLLFGTLSSEPFKVSLISLIMSIIKVAKKLHHLYYHVQNVMMWKNFCKFFVTFNYINTFKYLYLICDPLTFSDKPLNLDCCDFQSVESNSFLWCSIL